MEDMLQSKKVISIADACATINKKFNLEGKDKISNWTLLHWRKMGWVKFGEFKCLEIRHRPIGVSEEELESLIGFAYLNNYLGISYKKIQEVQHYLSNKDNLHLQKHINLYKPPTDDNRN